MNDLKEIYKHRERTFKMGFLQNVFIGSIQAFTTSYILYKLYGLKHWLFKYMRMVHLLYILFLIGISVSSKFINSFNLQELLSVFIMFYLLIFTPFFISIGTFMVKRLLSYEWDSKGLTYFLAVVWTFTVITLLLMVLFVIGFYTFIYLFYGTVPEFLWLEFLVQ